MTIKCSRCGAEKDKTQMMNWRLINWTTMRYSNGGGKIHCKECRNKYVKKHRMECGHNQTYFISKH